MADAVVEQGGDTKRVLDVLDEARRQVELGCLRIARIQLNLARIMLENMEAPNG